MGGFLLVEWWRLIGCYYNINKNYMTISYRHKLKNPCIPVSAAFFLCAFLFSGSQAFAQKGFEFGLRHMIQKSSLLNNSDTKAGNELDFDQPKTFLAGGVTATY